MGANTNGEKRQNIRMIKTQHIPPGREARCTPAVPTLLKRVGEEGGALWIEAFASTKTASLEVQVDVKAAWVVAISPAKSQRVCWKAEFVYICQWANCFCPRKYNASCADLLTLHDVNTFIAHWGQHFHCTLTSTPLLRSSIWQGTRKKISLEYGACRVNYQAPLWLVLVSM